MGRTMSEVIESLGEARDFYALAKRILSLCEPHGAVHSFRFIHNRGASRVACIIELEQPKQHAALARALGARTLNGSVCLEVPVGKDFGSPCKAATPHHAAAFDKRRSFAGEQLAQ
jgi:hypothetical protein